MFAPGDPPDLATRSLAGYGAVIRSVPVGVTCGTVIARPYAAAADASRVIARFAQRVAPPVIAWMALSMPPAASPWALATSFPLPLRADRQSARAGLLPDRYSSPHLPISSAAVGPIAPGLAATTR